MSKENIEQFMIQIAESEELQMKIPYEIDYEAQLLIALGAECGCEFTAEELQDSAAFRLFRAGRESVLIYTIFHSRNDLCTLCRYDYDPKGEIDLSFLHERPL
jgi:hypothetical protein